ncbi:MAG: hypothetical protein WBA51_02780 [Erythrobacter sp.]
MEPGADVAGLYLSSYFSRHRLLILERSGRYRLIHWKLDERNYERSGAREYRGRYELTKTSYGDQQVTLDFGPQRLLSGDDANDDPLLFMRSGEDRYLLRTLALDEMAFDIRENGRLGRADDYLFSATLSTPFGKEHYDGRGAPPVEDLPLALASLVTAEPLRMTIIQVDALDEPEEYEENRQVMCTLSLGEQDGLYMNMPLFSPEETGRGLKGWVWRMDPANCRAGIGYEVGDDGQITKMPRIGDVLTSRPPSAALP